MIVTWNPHNKEPRTIKASLIPVVYLRVGIQLKGGMIKRQRTRAAITICGVVFLALSIGTVSIGALVDKRPLIEMQLSNWSGRTVSLNGPFSVSMGLEPVITVEQFSLSNADWSSHPQMISAGSIEVTTSLLSILSGTLEIKSVTLREPKVILERSSDGRVNWIFDSAETTGAGDTAPESGDSVTHPMGGVNQLRITGGEVLYQNISAEDGLKLTLNSFEASHTPETRAIALHAEGALLDGKRMFARLTGTGRPESGREPGAFSLSTLYVTDGQQYSLSELSGTLGGAPVSGNIAVEPGKDGRPRLTGSMDVNLLDVQGFFEIPVPAELETAPSPPAKYLFSEHSLPLAGLKAADVDMQLTIRNLPLHANLDLNEVTGKVQLSDGLLALNDAKGVFAAGTVNLNYQLDTRADPARYTMKLSADDFDYGEWMTRKNLMRGVSGKGDLELELTGEGNALHDMASTADGHFSFISEKGEIVSKDLKIVALSLDESIASIVAKKSDRMPVHCMMMRYSIKDGKASSHTALLHAGVFTVLGAGSVNFQNERLFMSVHTRTNSASLGSFIPPVELSGSWFQPTIKWDASGSAAEMFDSLGSLLASPVTLISNALDDSKPNHRSSCQQALADNEADIQSIRKNKGRIRGIARSIGDTGESIANGVGDIIDGIGSLF